MKLTLLLGILFPVLLLAELPSKEEIEIIKKDKLILKEIESDEGPWPVILIYTMIETTAENSAAIFSAYHNQKDYVPNVLTSIPVKAVTPTDIHMSYEMKIPWPLSNTHYTTGNRLTKLADGSFDVEWYYVSSDSTEDNKGHATFTPFENKTIFTYKTFVKPRSIFAKLIKSKMKSDVKKTIEAIVLHIEKRSKDKSAETIADVEFMNKILSGVNLYETMVR